MNTNQCNRNILLTVFSRYWDGSVYAHVPSRLVKMA